MSDFEFCFIQEKTIKTNHIGESCITLFSKCQKIVIKKKKLITISQSLSLQMSLHLLLCARSHAQFLALSMPCSAHKIPRYSKFVQVSLQQIQQIISLRIHKPLDRVLVSLLHTMLYSDSSDISQTVE